MKTNDLDKAEKLLGNPLWRINNLYNIVDKEGNKVPFRMNPEQESLYRNMWYLNIILKARQLGISTLIGLIFLDRCLFNSNVSAGIVCATKEDSESFFKRIKFAFDCLPDEIKELRSANNDTKNELFFNNGSSIRVGMLMRGSTLQYLHISEMGKISSKTPDKAIEILTGSLNTLAPGQYCFIESTAEGRENIFFDLCKKAQDLKDSRKTLSKLDWKFFFFPWFQHLAYRLKPDDIVIPTELNDYFDNIETKTKCSLDPEQRAWYAKKLESQGEYMKREYPSTPEESFESATEGNYYSGYLTRARQEGRVTKLFHIPNKPVNSAWDLGFADSTAIWLFQIDGQRINILEYYENSGEALPHYINWLKAKSYNYGVHLAPHDIAQHELGSGLTRIEIARSLGVNFIPVSPLPVSDGIESVRNILNRCFFDEEKCSVGIRMLDSYRKEWNDRHGCWSTKPRHDFSSHGCFVADTFIDCKDGRKRICDIKSGDLVCTPNGYKKVLQTYTYEADELLEISTTNSKFICTKNHKIFTENGLIYADDLKYDEAIYNNTKRCKWLCRMLYGSRKREKNIGFRESFTSQKTRTTSSTKRTNTNGMGIITKGITMQKRFHPIFTGPFGQIILERSQLDITSIIKTGIQEITTSKICNAYLKPPTCPMLPNKVNGLGARETNYNLSVLKKKQNCGMQARKVENGILNMVSKLGRTGKQFLRSVWSVGMNTRLGILVQNIAIIAARPFRDVNQALITRIGNVKFVKSISLLINTLPKERVIKIVPLNLQVTQKVYDFEVEDDHCYYANGILVSNSDAFRILATGFKLADKDGRGTSDSDAKALRAYFGLGY